MKLQFFMDFDGTITKHDVVAMMVNRFCRPGWQEINARWERKEITTEECARQTFRLFGPSAEELYGLLDEVEIDEYFYDFVDFCREKGHELYIVSDGYDMIIEYLLKKHGIGDLPFWANQLVQAGNCYDISCPHLNKDCGQCGTCKRKVLQLLQKEGYSTVYIGDGYSDTCVVKAADIVFAKDDLLLYCRKNNIHAFPFRDFGDIARQVELLAG